MKAYKLLDESVIWEDGSRTYPPKMAKPADPPGTWPWSPPAGATVVDIATETPAQHPGIAVGEPYPGPVVSPAPPGAGPVVSPAPAPVIQPHHEIEPLPVAASAVDVWDRWQKLVTGWGCIIAWGGGDLDKLTAIMGDMPLYKQQFTMLGVIQNAGDVQLPELVGSTLWEDGSRTYPPKVKGISSPPDPPGRWGWPRPGTPTSKTTEKFKTAIGWWRHVQAVGADKATSAAEIAKDLDARGLVEQFNDLAGAARSKGYKGCPPPALPPGAPSVPAPPPPPSPTDDALSPLSDARAGIGRAWAGLSPGGKLVAGAAGLTGAILILRGVTK